MQNTLAPAPKSSWLGKLSAITVFAYILVILYGDYNLNQSNFIIRILFTPAFFMLAGAMLMQPGRLRQWDIRFLCLYVLWIAVDTLIISRVTMYRYEDTVYYVAAFALGCYPMASLLPKEERGRTFRGMFHVFIAVITALCILGLTVVLLQTQLETARGQLTGIPAAGEGDQRLYIIGMHGNFYAPIICIMLMMAIYMILSYKNVAVRIYYVIVALILYITLPLSDSRTNMVAVAVGLGLLAMLLVLWRVKWKPSVLGAIVAVLCAGVVAVGAYAGYGLAMRGIESVAVKSAVAEEAAGSDVQLPKSRDLLKDLKTATGRTGIWKETFQSVKEKPVILLTGLTNHHTYEAIPSFPQFDGRLHNSFIQVLIAFGLPALILVLCFLVVLAKRCIPLFFKPGLAVSLADRFLPVVLACCLVISMLESFFFLESPGMYSPLFYLVAGYVMVTVGEAEGDAGALPQDPA